MVSNLFVLDKNLRTKKALTVNGKNTFFSDIYNMNLSTGTESYEFSTNVEGIDESDYIMFHYHDQYKLFQITEIEQNHEEGKIITTVYGECASLELINGAVRPLAETVEMNAVEFINMVLKGSEWQIYKYSKSLLDKKIPIKIDKTTQRWQLIQDYMGSFGYEINTHVKYENGFVKAKYIDVYAEGGLGNVTYKRFEYGRNVKGITKKKDIYDFCTALILDTKQDVKDTEYDIGGYTKAKGDDVIYATNENKKYNAGRQYIFGVYEDNNSETPGEVIENALAELKKRAVPHFDYECDTALTYAEYEDINIGDTVYVIDHSFTPMVTLQARVGELEISFTDRDNCKCNLTNYKEIRSKIDVKLTAGINDIINTYFPLGGDKIAGQVISPNHLNTVTYDHIRTDIVQAEIAEFRQTITEEIVAKKGTIGELYAGLIETDELYAEKISAAEADITVLNSQVGEIDTIINGHLTSDNIQSLILTTDKVTVQDAFIKDAMIDTISANKITAGTINTEFIDISNKDGSLLMNSERIQFNDIDADGNATTRIQIGKDAEGDFTFVLYDETGEGVLIDSEGIKASAISDGLIVDDMVANNAGIQGSKLDINSVITSINEDGSETLSATKIKLDDKEQTLEVAFNNLTTKVETIEGLGGDVSGLVEQVTSNTTKIDAQQGQIDTLISNTTITKEDGQVVQLKDEYSATKQTVNEMSTKIGSLETNYKKTLKVSSVQYYLSNSLTLLSGGTWSDTAPEWTEGKYMWQRMKYTYTDGSVTYGDESCIAGAKGQDGAKGDTGEKGQSLVSSTPQWYLSTSSTTQAGGSWSDTMPTITSGKYLWLRYELKWQNPTATTYSTPTLEKIAEAVKEVSSKQSSLEQDLDGFKTEVSETYATTDSLAGYTTKTEFQQTNEDFTFRIQQTGGGNLLRNSNFYDAYNYKYDYWKFWGTAAQFTDLMLVYEEEGLFVLTNTTTNSAGGFYQYHLPIEANTTYTLSTFIGWSTSISTPSVAVELYNPSSTMISTVYINGLVNDVATRQSVTFTTPSDAYYANVVFNYPSSGVSDTSNSYITIKYPCLVEGYGALWIPNSKEIYDGIVRIDKNGLTVYQGSNKTVLDSSSLTAYQGSNKTVLDTTSLKFYSGSNNYSNISGGSFNFTDPSGNKVGMIGRNSWVNNPTSYLSVMNAEYGCVAGLGARYKSSDTTYTTPIGVSSTLCNTGNYYWEQGLNISDAYLTGVLYVRPTSNSYYSDKGAYGRIYTSTSDYLFMQGRYRTYLSTYSGNALYAENDTSQVNNTYLHIWAPTNFHNFSIYNATMASSLEGASTYTKSLSDSSSLEMFIYAPYSLNKDELRYTCSETMATYEEYDDDNNPTGVYICYCEIPIFMAENIQENYHINIGKIGWGDYRIIEKTPYFFVVESKENGFAFTYEVIATRIEKPDNNAIVANIGYEAGEELSESNTPQIEME